MLTATLIAFFLGTLLGALMAWPRSGTFVKYILPSVLILGAIPAYLIALILIYFVAFQWKLLPLGGGYGIGTIPNASRLLCLEVIKHSILPAFALVITSMGGWAIGMRGMMVTVQGEDYMTFAEAKGLKEKRLFYKYGMRNAMLPQVTGLALAFSFLVSGAVLVELVFGYPGVGTLLARSITQLDYFMIYGIVLFIVIAIALAMFIMDLIYPLLDPRIREWTRYRLRRTVSRLNQTARGSHYGTHQPYPALYSPQHSLGNWSWHPAISDSLYRDRLVLHRCQGRPLPVGRAGQRGRQPCPTAGQPSRTAKIRSPTPSAPTPRDATCLPWPWPAPG